MIKIIIALSVSINALFGAPLTNSPTILLVLFIDRGKKEMSAKGRQCEALDYYPPSLPYYQLQHIELLELVQHFRDTNANTPGSYHTNAKSDTFE